MDVAHVGVVGGGVVGLTTALRLAQAGHRVECVRDLPAADTVSALAGGLWFPYHVEPRDRVGRWGRTSLGVLTSLVGDPEAGVHLREGVVVERGPADRWWLEGIGGWREATTEELPDGAVSGVVARLPVVTMPVHLRWLEERCRLQGVLLVEASVGGVEEAPGDVVVVAAGARSTALVPGLDMTPSRGQVALLSNPGVQSWYVDDHHPSGLTYVLRTPAGSSAEEPTSWACSTTDPTRRCTTRSSSAAASRCPHSGMPRCSAHGWASGRWRRRSRWSSGRSAGGRS